MTTKKTAKKAPRKKRKSSTRINDPRKDPKQWTRWVIAARDIILGETIASAAAGISLSERQLKNWKNHEAWADALDAAETVCLQGIKHHSIAAVHKSVKRGNAAMGAEMMKLLMKQLQPKKDEGDNVTSVTVNLGYGARGPMPVPAGGEEASDVPAIRSA